MKWQEAAKLIGGGTGVIALISILVILSGMSYEHSGDMYCEDTCESYINITTRYWRVCFEESDKEETLYKKQSRSRTLWVNLNNIDNIISTEPSTEVEWVVPTYGRKWRPIKSGDCWDRGRVNKIKLIGHKRYDETVKWSFNFDDKINIDPKWIKTNVTYTPYSRYGDGVALIESQGFYELPDKRIVKRNEVPNLLEADLIGEGKVWSCEVEEDKKAGIKCNSINITDGKWSVYLEPMAKEVGTYPIKIKKYNYTNKEYYFENIGEISFSSLNEKKELNVLLDGCGEEIHIGPESTIVHVKTNATNPKTQFTTMSQESPNTVYGGLGVDLRVKPGSTTTSWDFLMDWGLDETIPPGITITAGIFSGYTTFIDGAGNSSGHCYLSTETFDFKTETWNTWCGGDHLTGSACFSADDEIMHIPDNLANTAFHNLTMQVAELQELYESSSKVIYCFPTLHASEDHDGTRFDDQNGTYTPSLMITYEVGNTAPSVPTLNSPANNTNTTTLIPLNWINSTDDDGDSITYYLEVDDDNDFSSPEYVNTSIKETISPTEDLPTGLSHAKYFWKVLATDGEDNSSWSLVRAFSYDAITTRNASLFLDGFRNNLNVELGSPINVSGNATFGHNITIDIDHPDYGIAYITGVDIVAFDLNINYFRREEMNDSKTKTNLTYNGEDKIDIGIKGHQYDELIDLTLNVTGYPDNGINPSNVKIYVNNSLSNSLGTLYKSGDYNLNSFSDGDGVKNTTLSGGSVATVGYLKIPSTATVTDTYLNITGYNTGGIDPLSPDGSSLRIDGGVATHCGNKTYDFVELKNGASLYVCDYDANSTKGLFFINATYNITVDKTSQIVGGGRGYRGSSTLYTNGEGPGGGGRGWGTGPYSGGGGAGYAKSGGFGGNELNAPGGEGGLSYGSNSSKEFVMGSGGGIGGGSVGGHGGDGGGSFYLLSEMVNISGNITTIGHDGQTNDNSGGAGSGGIIIIEATYIYLHNLLDVHGGAGSKAPGSWGTGGGGSGGMIKLFYASYNSEGFAYNLSGGSAMDSPYGNGTAGGDGLIYQEQTGNFTYNPFFEAGNIDGTREWNYYGHFNGKHNKTKDFAASINTYLASCTPDANGDCLVPLYLYSESDGIIEISDINVAYTYNVNPITLDIDLVSDFLTNESNFSDIPITFYSATKGIIEVDDINFNYAGGNDTIEVRAYSVGGEVNESYNITYFYSRWDYTLPQHITYFEVIPRTPTTDNITPFGQTDSRAMLNISMLNYGGRAMNFSVYQNESEKTMCVNMTISLDNYKSNGTFIINQTWTNLVINATYQNKTDLWFWFDYNCNYTTWRLWQPDFYFRGCAYNTTCSEAVI